MKSVAACLISLMLMGCDTLPIPDPQLKPNPDLSCMIAIDVYKPKPETVKCMFEQDMIGDADVFYLAYWKSNIIHSVMIVSDNGQVTEYAINGQDITINSGTCEWGDGGFACKIETDTDVNSEYHIWPGDME